MSTEPRAVAPACSLSQRDLGSRRARWLDLAESALREQTPTATGVCLRFGDLAGVEAELRDLAASERECCAFADWSVRRENGNLVLRVSAEGDAIAAVHAMFEQPTSARAGRRIAPWP